MTTPTIDQARHDGARAAIHGKPNIVPARYATSQAATFAWREGYAEYTGKFAIVQEAESDDAL